MGLGGADQQQNLSAPSGQQVLAVVSMAHSFA